MKKIILGILLPVLFIFAFSSSPVLAQEEEEPCEESEGCIPEPPKYYRMGQTGPNTFCCVPSTNSLDTCTGIPCL